MTHVDSITRHDAPEAGLSRNRRPKGATKPHHGMPGLERGSPARIVPAPSKQDKPDTSPER